MQVGIKISPARNDNHCEFGCWHKCCPLGGLAAEAETSVCPVPAVSAAAGKLAAAAMPPAIRTLRREVRAVYGRSIVGPRGWFVWIHRLSRRHRCEPLGQRLIASN